MNLRYQRNENPDLVIRNIDEGSEISYCKLFMRVFSQPPWNESWTTGRVSMDFRRNVKRKNFIGMSAFYGSVSAGFIAGYRMRIFPAYYLGEFFVDPEMQGKGVGGVLFENLSGSLRILGINRIVLLTGSGTPAEKFYLKHGFKRIFPLIKINGKGIYCGSI
jgi:aminoglycoside 6'-N-acetyltransferase I